MKDFVRRSSLSAAFAGLLAGAGPAGAEAIGYHYDIYVGGSQVAEMRVTVDRSGDRYRMTTAVGLVGLAAMFSDWQARSESEGRIEGGRLIPDRYESHNLLRGEARRVALTFADGVLTDIVAEPSAAEDERDPVSATQRQGAIDPLTAVLAAILSPVDCGGNQRLFDGRRVTEIGVKGATPSDAPRSDYGIYAGPAMLCAYTVENVAGRSRRWEGERRGAEETMVWLAQVAGDLAVPVRLEADTNWGALRGHLVAIGPLDASN